MIFRHLRLEALVPLMPEEILSSKEIESRLSPLYERLGLPEGRLELMTGISERRLWPEGTLPSTASAMAGQACLKHHPVGPDDIDLLIHASVSRDALEPATASMVHRQLGLGSHCQVFDLSNACLGFLNACSIAGAMIDSGQIRRAMIVMGENGRPLIDGTLQELLKEHHTRKTIKDQFASLTIGCGAVAALLCHEELAPDSPKLLGGYAACDSTGSDLCHGDSAQGDTLSMQTDSEQLLKQGVNLAEITWEGFCNTLHWDKTVPKHFVTHQVGSAHRRLLYDTLGLPIDKDHSTFEHFGNIGSVSLPFTLHKAQQARNFNKGDHIALLGIGSGINCLMMGVEW
jgi:acyl-CoA:acyl-CoA alkyltransferase